MSLQPSADAWAVAALGEATTYVAKDSFMCASVLGSDEVYCVIVGITSLQLSWVALTIPGLRFDELFALRAFSAGESVRRRATVRYNHGV